MTAAKRDELIIDMHGKVAQMYGVLYEDGLVAKIERHEEVLREGHLTCPIRAEVGAVDKKIEDHLEAEKTRKYQVPAWVVIVIGVVALVAPFVERALWKK